MSSSVAPTSFGEEPTPSARKHYEGAARRAGHAPSSTKLHVVRAHQQLIDLSFVLAPAPVRSSVHAPVSSLLFSVECYGQSKGNDYEMVSETERPPVIC